MRRPQNPLAFPADPAPGESLITLKDLDFSYDGQAAASLPNPVLDGISLDIRQGESLALGGPNGCGKSTLLKILCGLVFCQSGDYRYRGAPVTQGSLKVPAFAGSFRQQVGMLFQNSEAQLFCPLVWDEVAFGPRQMGLDDAEVSRRTADCLDLLGISHLARQAPFLLSGGEKRKVALASVLSLNPRVLVLDEPMNGLDPRSKKALAALLGQLKAAGKTIICATHDFAYVEGIFDRMVVISQIHQVIRDGSFAEITADHDFLASCNME